jgi:hypothetical protein
MWRVTGFEGDATRVLDVIDTMRGDADDSTKQEERDLSATVNHPSGQRKLGALLT